MSGSKVYFHLYTPERLLLLLVAATIAVLVFRSPLLEKRLLIAPGDTTVRFELDSDVQDGGNTVTEWIDKDKLEWRCTLGQAWPYPFCGMQIYFSDSYMNGIDLRSYTDINFRLHYQGSADSVRVFLRNSNPEYTKPDEIRSTKFNAIEIDTRYGPEYKDVQLEYFILADWWMQLYDLEMHQLQTDFSNVGIIEIQTGTGLKDGVHTFKLDYIELVGVRISLESLYLGIIVVWIVAILLYLAARIRMLTLAVQLSQEKQAELTEINSLLDKRSRTLEERIKLDPLTGAYNRTGIEDSLADAFSIWRIKAKPFSLLLVDVDNFKAINDNHGHTVGDIILRELTTVISENIREDDHLARWGGEEFIIVCTDTGLKSALETAEKVRKLIEQTIFTNDLRITVSIGVAKIGPHESLDNLFDRADKALYKAKNDGRNKVKAAD